MIVDGTLSHLRALREARSRARSWSHRTTPVVLVPTPINDTAKPAMRAKWFLPPIGSAIGVCVSRLKAEGDAGVLIIDRQENY